MNRILPNALVLKTDIYHYLGDKHNTSQSWLQRGLLTIGKSLMLQNENVSPRSTKSTDFIIRLIYILHCLESGSPLVTEHHMNTGGKGREGLYTTFSMPVNITNVFNHWVFQTNSVRSLTNWAPPCPTVGPQESDDFTVPPFSPPRKGATIQWHSYRGSNRLRELSHQLKVLKTAPGTQQALHTCMTAIPPFPHSILVKKMKPCH